MSIPVDLDRLAAEIALRGPVAYLLTGGGDGRPRVNHIATTVEDDGRIVAPIGRRGAANVAERPAVSLLWPVRTPEDYSLIVDGDAVVGDDCVVVTPTWAVLHRPAEGAAGLCAADCVPLDGVA